MRFLLFITMIICGCKSMRSEAVDSFEYRFERSVDVALLDDGIDDRKIVIQFDNVPFGQAMGILSSEYGVPIVWSSQLDKEFVSGRFDDIPLLSVLNILARRVGSSVANVGGMYYLGEILKEDRAFCVLRIPPVETGVLLTASGFHLMTLP